jgi:hypothetical protein
MDPERLLQQAQAALERGASIEDVNARLQMVSQGEFRTLSELQSRVAPTGPGAAQTEPGEDPGSRNPALRDFFRSMWQGATLGAAPEIAGMIPRGMGTGAGPGMGPGGRPLPPPPQEQLQAQEREAREDINRIREERPGMSFAGEMLGGAAIPGMGAAGTTRAMLARGFGPIMSGAAGGAVGGGLGGSLFGGLEGLPNHEDPGAPPTIGGRVGGAALGGVLGAPLGAAFGAGAATLGRILSPARARAQDEARRAYTRALREAGIPEHEIPARLAALGPEAVPGDLSRSLAQETRAAMDQATSLANAPRDRIRTRAAARGDRMVADLREAAGLPRRDPTLFDKVAMEAESEAISRGWYQPLEEALGELVTPNVDAVMAQLSELPGQVGRTISQAARDFLPEGRVRTLRDLQDLRAHLRNNEIPAAQQAGRNRDAGLLQDAVQELTDAMQADVPGLDAADRTWSTMMRRREAYQEGLKMAEKPLDEFRNAFRRTEGPEAQEAFRQGVLDAFERKLSDEVGGIGTGSLGTKLEALTPKMRQRLELLLTSDPELARMVQMSNREGRYATLWQEVSGGSPTAGRENRIETQMPTASLRNKLGELTAQVIGGTQEERRMAAEILGRILLGEGEEAATRALANLNLRSAVLGGLGGAAGTAGTMPLTRGFPQGMSPEDQQIRPDPAGGGLFGPGG